MSAVGILVLIGIAFLFSINRKALQPRVILWGLGLQLAFALFILKNQIVKRIFFISQRTILIATYALCGLANFSSIAIQIGGIGGMAPTRRSDLAKLGLRAMFTGAMATATTACIAGILI